MLSKRYWALWGRIVDLSTNLRYRDEASFITIRRWEGWLLHIVWDWNGTLLDDLRLTVHSTNESIKDFTANRFTIASYQRAFRRPVRGFHEEFIGRKLDDAEWWMIDDRYRAVYRLGMSEVDLVPGAVEALRLAKGNKISQSLLSMTPHADLVDAVTGRGISTQFVRFEGAMERDRSSKVAALERHLSLIPVKGGDTVLVGDTVDDAAAAQACGAACVLVTFTSFEPAERLAAAAPVVPNVCCAVDRVSSGCWSDN